MESLDKVLESEVKPIVDRAIEKFLGESKDIKKEITDKIKEHPFLNLIVNPYMPYKESKKQFKKNYIERLLRLHSGEVTFVAKILDVDRRTIHRFIKELDINMSNIRSLKLTPEYVKKEAISSAINSSLKEAREDASPKKMLELYEQSPEISSILYQGIEFKFLTLKEAEKEFDKEYFSKLLQETKGSITKAAKQSGLRYETVHRKVKELNLR